MLVRSFFSVCFCVCYRIEYLNLVFRAKTFQHHRLKGCDVRETWSAIAILYIFTSRLDMNIYSTNDISISSARLTQYHHACYHSFSFHSHRCFITNTIWPCMEVAAPMAIAICNSADTAEYVRREIEREKKHFVQVRGS